MTDEIPPAPRPEPVFNIPAVITVCCLVLLGIHLARGFVSIETNDDIIAVFAFVPARAAIALDLAQSQLHLAIQNLPQETFLAVIGNGHGRWWSLVTYALLHGSWAHVGFNCVWLVAFGAPVARRFAPLRFLLLLVIASVVGAIVQFFWDMASFMPVIGASAAVAGAMGAATRFVFRSVDETIERFDRLRLEQAFRLPALSLRKTFATRTTLAFVAIWFLSNLLFGAVPALAGVGDGPIAWQAHIGGFLAGLLLFPLFDPIKPAAPTSDLPTDEARAP